jgi:glutamine amidotransferase
MIVVVDYGMGNLKSVLNAFAKLGAGVTVSGDPATVEEASAIVVPGVGAFGRCMENLESRGLAPAIRDTSAGTSGTSAYASGCRCSSNQARRRRE